MVDGKLVKAALLPTKDCLSIEQLERAAADATPNHPHLATCARCQAELALLKSFESDTPLPDEGAAVAWIRSRVERRFDEIKHPTRARQRREQESHAGALLRLARIFEPRKMRVLIPLVALAVIAVAVIMLRAGKEPALRAQFEPDQAVLRSEEVQTLEPTGELPQAPAVLRWKAVAGAQRYKAVIMEVDHSPLWAGETGELAITVPADIRRKLVARKPALWQVTALDSQGRELAVSQVQRFVVVAGKSSNSKGTY